ncbi:hypothetical protein CK203_103537 [Vitis vinifera]|uniref:Uncharacterized protein n=1 Tax=Vitis vinifera TaxID=29760 RepID=A0A438F848_VITVI|nr:hypothetical protein CK203_103537 [Vitis vinifera]
MALHFLGLNHPTLLSMPPLIHLALILMNSRYIQRLEMIANGPDANEGPETKKLSSEARHHQSAAHRTCHTFQERLQPKFIGDLTAGLNIAISAFLRISGMSNLQIWILDANLVPLLVYAFIGNLKTQLYDRYIFCWTTQATLGFLRQSTHASIGSISYPMLLLLVLCMICHENCLPTAQRSSWHPEKLLNLMSNIFAVKLADSSHQGELLGFPSICKVSISFAKILLQSYKAMECNSWEAPWNNCYRNIQRYLEATNKTPGFVKCED